MLHTLYDSPMAWLAALAWALPRFLVAFSIIPLLSREALPLFPRMGVVGGFALLVAPGLLEPAALPRPWGEALLIVGKEAFIGLIIGMSMAVPLWAMEAMGDLADTQRGTSIAQTLNPTTGHETSPLGQLFSQAMVTVLFAMGGFVMIVGLVYDSYALWPVFGWTPRFSPEAPAILIGIVDRLLYLAVLLGTPVIFIMFLAEAGLAIVSRFAPQLQVFFLAMPVKSGLAMLVFAVYAVVLFGHAQELVVHTARGTLDVLRGVFLPRG